MTSVPMVLLAMFLDHGSVLLLVFCCHQCGVDKIRCDGINVLSVRVSHLLLLTQTAFRNRALNGELAGVRKASW